MEVIYLKDLSGQGRAGQVKQVADGYALNFLIPKGYAKQLSGLAKQQINKQLAEKQKKQDKKKENERKTLLKLSGKTFTVKAKAGESGQLFAAVHEADVVKVAEKSLNQDLSDLKIFFPSPVKHLGTFEVEASSPSSSQKVQIFIVVNPE